jgi:MoaA/NifB/PqqE/SkfB family radical SAM enzyme
MDDHPYVSCPWIEYRLVFAVEKLLLCCVTNHGKGCPKVCDFTGGPLPLAEILSFRDEVRRANQTQGRYPLCDGCGWLERRVWEKRAHPFDHITIAHFTTCNLECSYCYVTRGGFHERPARPYDIYPILESMISRGLLAPKVFVFWGGGEPTLFHDFDRSFKLLMEYGAEQAVSTNATIVSPRLKEGLAKRKITLVCSVDAATPETYRRIKKRDCFDRVWRNLAEYVATGGRVDAKMIVMRENHHEVVPFLEKAQSVGIRTIVYDVDFHEPDQPDEIVEAIARLYYEGLLKRGLTIVEGGSGVPALGEELRARIRRRLDEMVTWEDVVALQERVGRSRAMRFARELHKYPLLMNLGTKTFEYLEKVYLRFRPGFY